MISKEREIWRVVLLGPMGANIQFCKEEIFVQRFPKGLIGMRTSPYGFGTGGLGGSSNSVVAAAASGLPNSASNYGGVSAAAAAAAGNARQRRGSAGNISRRRQKLTKNACTDV